MTRSIRLRRAARTTRAAPATALAPIEGRNGAGQRNLSEAVADAIVNAIALGELAPGQRMVENEIARKLAISRVPIREAIRILQAQGIVQVAPNRGARIASFDTVEIDQVFEARIALERIAARGAAAAYRREPRAIDRLDEIVMRMERAKHWADWAELRRCDVNFHHEMCRASGNEIVLKLWEALSRHITIIFGREIASERDFDVVIAEHQKLARRLAAGDGALDRELAAHILRLREPRKRAPQPAGKRPRRP